MAKTMIHVLHTKTRGFDPQTPEIDEIDENGGCHSGKITVCQKHRVDNPDLNKCSAGFGDFSADFSKGREIWN